DALDIFHDQVRRGFDVPEGHQHRMMRTLREGSQHHATDFESDDVDGAFAGTETRNLDDERERAVGAGQAVDRRHAAGVKELAQAKAVDFAARLQRSQSLLRTAVDSPGESSG